MKRAISSLLIVMLVLTIVHPLVGGLTNSQPMDSKEMACAVGGEKLNCSAIAAGAAALCAAAGGGWLACTIVAAGAYLGCAVANGVFPNGEKQ